ncbi:hypothetical protein [Calothrix sp. PCC 6303]|uniref:hypothetical protein n=1 Tax=Calothrix sp. PCC 6303 TaxID=1170562 RepID=UPI0002A056AB|nr:hypothetical protein [Calothrix sp. PCC 6303]AFZ00772.1 hypothetical protein Cal6303_1734 [Calothrix sp. PCC 6303]
MEGIKVKIIEVATKIINDDIDLLYGCRTLVNLERYLEDSPNEFLILRGIDSETDIFPIDQTERKQWNPDKLLELDKEKSEYIALVKNQIIEACKTIITSMNSLNKLYE